MVTAPKVAVICRVLVGLGMLGGDCTGSGCSLQSAGVDGTVLDLLKGKGVV